MSENERVLSRDGEPLKNLTDHFGITEPGDGKEWVAQPTKQRPGDQVIPDGDESLIDDQQLLIDDITARRQVGIERYGQGHRPFNGRDTLRDFYEEQLDGLVYLRSIVRMVETRKEELVPVVADVIESLDGMDCKTVAEAVITRIQGHLVVASEVTS